MSAADRAPARPPATLPPAAGIGRGRGRVGAAALAAALGLALLSAPPASAQLLFPDRPFGTVLREGEDEDQGGARPRLTEAEERMEARRLLPAPPAPPPEAEPALPRPGAVVRALDRIGARRADLRLMAGETARFGRLEVLLHECRVPEDNPEGDAYARLAVRDVRDDGEVLFSGWMIASSPALSAMEHARYDVWLLSCIAASGDSGGD